MNRRAIVKIVVTGGTGVIGRATITELLRRGHSVRLVSRGAAEDAASWDGGVEAFPADVADASALAGAADGCDAVIHVVGIVEETPPDVTFDAVNVQGTRNVVAETSRAGVRRLVFVSSLGAGRGESGYHRSKREAEAVTQEFGGDWVIVRTGAVMGPGDETVSVLLRMMRTLPAVPMIDDGQQPFQPVWHEDVAWALAECVEREDVARRTLHVAGPDVVTVREVLDIFAQVTGRSPLRVPLPSFLAKVGSSVAGALGIETPVSAATVQMLLEGNYVRDDEANDLTGLLGHLPLPTPNRLVELADQGAEQTPDAGVGRLQRRRFHIDIHGSGRSAGELLELFRSRFAAIVPFEAAAEPGAPEHVEEGSTLTLQLPVRGHVQVRVEHLDARSFTLATLEGHPLAGVVRFRFDERDGGVVRFSIDVAERPASRVDQLSMALGGSAAQKRTWAQTAERLADAAGGTAPDGVVEESWALDDSEAGDVEDWVKALVRRRERGEDRNGTG
jgi:uncharacterized protein YbjT (DUF2867 family)